MVSWHTGDVMVDGVRLHYTRTGGDKSPLLLAHGVTDSGLCWSPVAQALADDYDVVMVDVRGHGQSDAPETGYSPLDQAADLHRLIQALGLKRPAVLGHSMGALTVLLNTAAMLQFFERVGIPTTYYETDGGHDWIRWRRYLAALAPLLFVS